MTQQRQLKKRLRELKRIRTAVIVGEDTRYTERQVNDAIEKIRNEMKSSKPKKIVIKEEEKEMARVAKITVEQYKEYAGQGLKVKEIAEKVGLSDASVYAYKQKWENEGLLDVEVTEKVSVVKSDELDRLTQIHAELASEHELLKEENSKLTENNRLLTNKINDVLKAGQSTDKLQQQLHDAKTAYEHESIKNTELNEQMDDLEAQNNVLKERYENHEKELHEEIAYLKDELAAERDKHNNDSDLQQRYDHLATIAKPVLKSFVESL